MAASPTAEAIPLGVRQAESGPVREAAVSSAAARRTLLSCPVCGNATVTVEGQFRREFREELVDGRSQGHQLSPDLEKNVLAIGCTKCGKRYVIEPDEMFTLREQIVELNMELAALRGQPVDAGNEQVN
jgi:hypothetical protein